MSDLIMPNSASEKALLKCIDKSFDIFGESGKRALYWHLESEYGIIMDKISEDPCRLTDALRKIFGPGVRTIEVKLIKEICRGCSRLSLIKTFNDAVNCLERRCSEERLVTQHPANKE